MVNIRDLFQKKEQRGSRRLHSGTHTVYTGREALEKKLFGRRLRIGAWILLGVMLLSAVVLGIYLYVDQKVYTGSRVENEVPYHVNATAETLDFGGRILHYSRDGIWCLGKSGKDIWNRTYEMQNPLVDICGDYVAIADYNGHTVYLMDGAGVVGEIDTGMPVRNLCVSATGTVAALVDDLNVAWIYVYTAGGERFVDYKTTMAGFGYPMAMDISAGGEMMAVAYVYADAGEIKSRVGYYRFDGIGQQKVDQMVSSSEYTDAIVPLVVFLDDQTSFAMADNQLEFFKGLRIPASHLKAYLPEEVLGVYHGAGHVGIVYGNADADAHYKMDIYNSDGVVVGKSVFDQEVTDILFTKDRYILYNESEWGIYTMDGDPKFEGEFPEAVRLLIPTERKNRFVMVTNEKVGILVLE